jgi:hypothetical protein
MMAANRRKPPPALLFAPKPKGPLMHYCTCGHFGSHGTGGKWYCEDHYSLTQAGVAQGLRLAAAANAGIMDEDEE